jgi:ABC-type iron transport system FetAB ATPase subunit
MNEIVAIECKKLCLSFAPQTANALFDNLSFSIKAGERIAVTGPSGCGKSTLLRCLLGIVEPTAGEILINGQVLDAQSVWKIRGEIAFVPQEADLGCGIVREFIEKPFSYRINADKSDNLKRLPHLMQSVGLENKLLTSEIGSLSGGEKQRLALISALLLDRPILMLDEISSALDNDSAKLVFDLLKNLKNKTIIGAVHDSSKMPFASREIKIGEV